MSDKHIEKQNKENNNDAAGHRKRLRERFIRSGIDSLSDHEKVELMLFYTIPRRDTKPLAKKMLSSFKNLYALFDADPDEIVRRCDVSENTAVLFSMIAKMARSYALSKLKPLEYIDTPERAIEYAKALLTGEYKENFYIICLDKQLRLIRAEHISTGTVNSIDINIRQIVEKAVMHQSSYIILAHNHPGGSATASFEDIETTKVIRNALAYVDITVADHVIVAGFENYSFAKKGICGISYG